IYRAVQKAGSMLLRNLAAILAWWTACCDKESKTLLWYWIVCVRRDLTAGLRLLRIILPPTNICCQPNGNRLHPRETAGAATPQRLARHTRWTGALQMCW